VEEVDSHGPLGSGVNDNRLFVGQLVVIDFLDKSGANETFGHMVDDAVTDEVLVEVVGVVGRTFFIQLDEQLVREG